MYACRRCDETIPRDVPACPECGYDPAGTARDFAAVVLAFAVVLLIAVPPAGVLAVFVGITCYGWSALAEPARRVV